MRILAAILLMTATGCAPQRKVIRCPVYTKQERRMHVLSVIYAGGLITLGEILSRRN